MLFGWFLRDIVVAIEFGSHTDTIRQALGQRMAEDLDRSGLSPAVLLDLEQLRRERFGEYRAAIGANISLQALGTVAWRRIPDTEEPSDRMTMFLAMGATAELQAIRGLGRRYVVMGLPRSLFSASSGG